VDLSIRDILKPVIERSVTIALITTREIVLKDFAQDPSEQRLLKAANQMVQCLAGSLAMVTCREPLRMNIANKIRDIFQSKLPAEALRNLEPLVLALSKDNLDIGSTYIQQSVIAKAKQRVLEDTAICEALEKRRTTQPPYRPPSQDPTGLEFLPEPLLPKKDGLTPPELTVYNEFVSVLNRNTVQEQEERPKPSSYNIVDCLSTVHSIVESGSFASKEVIEPALQRFRNELLDTERSNKLLDQVVREIFQSYVKVVCSRAEDARAKSFVFLNLLCIIKEANANLPLKITAHIFKDCDDETKYNYECLYELFRNGLIHVASFDAELAKPLQHIPMLPFSTADALLTFVAHLVTKLMVHEKLIQPSHFAQTFTAMKAARATPQAQSNAAFAGMLAELESNKRGYPKLLEEWVSFTPDQPHEQLRDYFERLTAQLASTDDSTNTFFTGAIEMAIQQALFTASPLHVGGGPLISSYPDRLDYRLIDKVLTLLFTIMPVKAQASRKYFLAFMRALTGLLLRAHTGSLTQFNQRPYYRFFMMILQSLAQNESVLTPHSEFLLIVANALHDVAPLQCPAFAFAWLDLVSSRHFLPKLLLPKPEDRETERHANMAVLVCDMLLPLKFLLVSERLPSAPVQEYFLAALKVTLVIMHDFQEFVVGRYFDFLCCIPPHCIQLRNIVLSAIPKNVKAPEPQRINKVDKLPEQKTPPQILSDWKQPLRYLNIRDDVDKYRRTKQHSILLDICNKLMASDQSNPPKRADPEIFHALVLNLAELSVAKAESNKEEIDITFVLQELLGNLDVAARHSLLSAMFNELRYPNTYTHYFLMLLLYLFKEDKIPFLQEQILRIAVERRALSPPPHPWGLSIFQNELRVNSLYEIALKPFVKTHRELEPYFSPLHEAKSSKEDS
jgi:CCR4-NOT transcription complex subunit 1